MKNKKGFTLVELLAVIAILAILVIIALPNVMGMFNEAKKNSFTTELKEIYKVAQQQWISDSMFNTGEKVYARCSSQQCANQLELTGRKELEYFIKISKSGNITEYYATDGTYQFSYDGDLLATQINDVEEIAGLEKNEIIKISNSGLERGSVVTFKTLRGSFSTTEDVKETDIRILDDGYTYEYLSINFGTGVKSEIYNNAYIRIDREVMSNNSFVEIYDSNNVLLKKITINDFPKPRLDISANINLANAGYDYIIGDYDITNLRIVLSSDLQSKSMAYYTGYTNEPIKRTLRGPWIEDADSLSKINILSESLRRENYGISGYTKQADNNYNVNYNYLTIED